MRHCVIMRLEQRIVLGTFVIGAAICSPAPGNDEPAAATHLSPSEVLAASQDEEWRAPAPENTLYLELEDGRVVIELAPDFAPQHAARMKALARAGFYDGLDFYRVIEGFVAQAGDVEGARDAGELGRTTAAEFERSRGSSDSKQLTFTPLGAKDGYAPEVGYVKGFPAARDAAAGRLWLVHCPGAVAMARWWGA